jgi:hypothetical protein
VCAAFYLTVQLPNFPNGIGILFVSTFDLFLVRKLLLQPSGILSLNLMLTLSSLYFISSWPGCAAFAALYGSRV